MPREFAMEKVCDMCLMMNHKLNVLTCDCRSVKTEISTNRAGTEQCFRFSCFDILLEGDHEHAHEALKL